MTSTGSTSSTQSRSTTSIPGVKAGKYHYGYKGGAHLTTLGKKPDSHGCVRLSVNDAKWIYEQRLNGGLSVGSKVVLKNALGNLHRESEHKYFRHKGLQERIYLLKYSLLGTIES